MRRCSSVVRREIPPRCYLLRNEFCKRMYGYEVSFNGHTVYFSLSRGNVAQTDSKIRLCYREAWVDCWRHQLDADGVDVGIQELKKNGVWEEQEAAVIHALVKPRNILATITAAFIHTTASTPSTQRLTSTLTISTLPYSVWIELASLRRQATSDGVVLWSLLENLIGLLQSVLNEGWKQNQ